MISRVKGDVSCPQAASNQIIIAHVCSDIGFLGSEFVQIVAKNGLRYGIGSCLTQITESWVR